MDIEMLEQTDVAKPTRADIEKLQQLADRYAVLHEAFGNPNGIDFWGFSGD